MSTVIRIENLYKEYHLGVIGHGTLYRDLQSWWATVRGKEDPNSLIGQGGSELDQDCILALNNINLEIMKGEKLGIIGKNGAGKSTLLKILSRVTAPTKGSIKVKGLIASLLEVGTGFHAELTGRENIYLNGAINGMSKREVDKKLDEIISFAGVEKFIDTPVKRYSSGMYVRLGFSVAAHLNPDILVVDEVLAVGDAEFQKKCLGKMQDIAGEERTILFVSHNMSSIEKLCNRAILIEEGKIINDGEPSEVISNYLTSINTDSKCERIWEDKETAPGNNMVRLRRACIRPKNGVPSDTLYVTTPIVLEFEYWNLIPDLKLNVAIALFNQDGVFVFASLPLHEPVWDGKPFPIGLFKTSCDIPGSFLNNGTYHIRMQIVEDHIKELFRDPEILAFEIHDSQEMRSKYGGWHERWKGVVRPDLVWETEKLD
jgi:lipopolysaccharide transport system ATP-binding protein